MSPAAMGKLRVTVQPSTLPRASRNCCGPSLCAITSLGNQAVDITAGMKKRVADIFVGAPYQTATFLSVLPPSIRQSIHASDVTNTLLTHNANPRLHNLTLSVH